MVVRRFRNIWFALTAFLWLPAFGHCQLESLTGLEFLQCKEDVAGAHSSAQDCTGCCAVEKSLFRTSQARLSTPQPDLFPIFFTALLTAEPEQPSTGDWLEQTSAPPELPQCWHFLSRTALPVRAPSFAS